MRAIWIILFLLSLGWVLIMCKVGVFDNMPSENWHGIFVMVSGLLAWLMGLAMWIGGSDQPAFTRLSVSLTVVAVIMLVSWVFSDIACGPLHNYDIKPWDQ